MKFDAQAAWRRFHDQIEARGGRVVEPSWLGSKKPHRVTCIKGHETTPTPGSVNQGHGCIVCAGKDQGAAWRVFCQLVEERGGQVLEPKPLGNGRPHRVRCAEGHDTVATPSYVRTGGGICNICSPTSTLRAERYFRDFVASQGGIVLEPSWLGNKVPHRIQCGQGHLAAPRPNDVQQTGSICRVCAGHDSETSWREFRARVVELGGTVVEPEWLGNKKPHQVICARGHSSRIRPNNVQQGGGICRTCAYKVWDVFYIVANDADQAVKFGITSYDPRARLRYHEINGFGRVIKTITGMPEAPKLERKILTSLRTAGITAIAGREYFDLTVLPLILQIVDSWSRTEPWSPPVEADRGLRVDGGGSAEGPGDAAVGGEYEGGAVGCDVRHVEPGVCRAAPGAGRQLGDLHDGRVPVAVGVLDVEAHVEGWRGAGGCSGDVHGKPHVADVAEADHRSAGRCRTGQGGDGAGCAEVPQDPRRLVAAHGISGGQVNQLAKWTRETSAA